MVLGRRRKLWASGTPRTPVAVLSHVVVSTFILALCEEMLCAVPLLCRGDRTNVLQRVGQRRHDVERPPVRTGGKSSGYRVMVST